MIILVFVHLSQIKDLSISRCWSSTWSSWTLHTQLTVHLQLSLFLSLSFTHTTRWAPRFKLLRIHTLLRFHRRDYDGVHFTAASLHPPNNRNKRRSRLLTRANTKLHLQQSSLCSVPAEWAAMSLSLCKHNNWFNIRTWYCSRKTDGANNRSNLQRLRRTTAMTFTGWASCCTLMGRGWKDRMVSFRLGRWCNLSHGAL